MGSVMQSGRAKITVEWLDPGKSGLTKTEYIADELTTLQVLHSMPYRGGGFCGQLITDAIYTGQSIVMSNDQHVITELSRFFNGLHNSRWNTW